MFDILLHSMQITPYRFFFFGGGEILGDLDLLMTIAISEADID